MRLLDFFQLVRQHVSFRHPRLALRKIAALRKFVKESEEFKEMSGSSKPTRFSLVPILGEKSAQSATLTYHYFFQDLWMAKEIYSRKPCRLIDVGSRVDGFVAHVACFREIEILDIRPLDQHIPNVIFHQVDVTGGAGRFRQSADAVSCLHVLEHFGLGRYGDELDPLGYLKGFETLFEILSDAGLLFFSTIIGEDSVMFNAHRIFSLRTLLTMFEGRFEVLKFAVVTDSNTLLPCIHLTEDVIASNAGQRFGCGMFVLRKTTPQLLSP